MSVWFREEIQTLLRWRDDTLNCITLDVIGRTLGISLEDIWPWNPRRGGALDSSDRRTPLCFSVGGFLALEFFGIDLGKFLTRNFFLSTAKGKLRFFCLR